MNTLKALLANTPDVITIFSKDGRYVEVSAAAAEVIGRSVEEIKGKTFSEVLPTEVAQEFMHTLTELRETREPMTKTDVLVIEGQERVFESRFFPVQTAAGAGEEYFGAIATDITEKERAQEELVRAREKAEASDRAKSEFLAIMSHEIRTPLNGIVGMLQLLNSTALNDEQCECVELGLRSADRLTHLLSDLLELATIEAGKLRIVEAEFSVSRLLQSISELFELGAREKGLRLSLVPSPDLPDAIIGDQSRLKQILFNLVGNAVKFTHEGEVCISAEPVDRGPGRRLGVAFAVSDSGVGIPRDRLDQLADPFKQVDSSHTRSHEGAGLGLAVVHRLVKLMNGAVSIDSVEGEGTTVRVVLPLKRAGNEAPSDSVQGEEEPHDEHCGVRILVAEDDRLNQIALQRLLESNGHRITVVNDGREVIERLRAEEFDCVLLDVQMPVMNGVEATREIRQAEKLNGKRHIPIIAVTAYAGFEDREKFIQAGMDDYLAKPVLMEDLQRVLARHVIGST